MRGCGRQKIGATINLVTYWVVGLPAAVALAFWGRLGALGLWTGLACTASVQALLMTLTVFRWVAGGWRRGVGGWRGLGVGGQGPACTASVQALLMTLTVFRWVVVLQEAKGARSPRSMHLEVSGAMEAACASASLLPAWLAHGCCTCCCACCRFDWHQEAIRAKQLVAAGEWVVEDEPGSGPVSTDGTPSPRENTGGGGESRPLLSR
jgi:hypothetical protein